MEIQIVEELNVSFQVRAHLKLRVLSLFLKVR